LIRVNDVLAHDFQFRVNDVAAFTSYYVLVSMVLNVDRTPMPGGAKPPLPQLK
jgi:hypothetical protein